jgi:hypothetical protein
MKMTERCSHLPPGQSASFVHPLSPIAPADSQAQPEPSDSSSDSETMKMGLKVGPKLENGAVSS